MKNTTAPIRNLINQGKQRRETLLVYIILKNPLCTSMDKAKRHKTNLMNNILQICNFFLHIQKTTLSRTSSIELNMSKTIVLGEVIIN